MHVAWRIFMVAALAGAAPVAAAADTPPDEELLEFLGSWGGGDADADWRDLLDAILRDEPEPEIEAAPPAAPSAGGNHGEH
jgi:hypothetical protein